jgi:hypothetical protein
MRPLRACGLLFALVGMAALLTDAGIGRGQEKTKPEEKPTKGFAGLGDLQAEVTVLQVLHSLQPTLAQLEILEKAAATTMQKPPPRKVIKVTDKYRKSLMAMRDALLSGDEDKIEEASEALDEVRDKEESDFDEIEVTDDARKEAPKVLRLFSAKQVAQYVGGLEDFPDPMDRIREAIDQSQKRTGKDWMSYRDDVAYQVGWLVAGLDSDNEEKLREKVTTLLNKAAGLGKKDFSKKRVELLKSARTIVGKVGPTDVIRNFMERLFAETLSNHRLTTVIAAKKKVKEE